MPVVPFIPMIASAAASGIGGLMGKRAQDKAKKEGVVRSPAEAQAMAGVSGQARNLAGQGNQLMGQGQQLLQGPANYYKTLMSGDRNATSVALAPQMAQVTDVYRGAERNLDRTGVRGAQRDQQMGELGRERASKLAGLVTGVQPAAAGALATMGNQFMQHGGQLGAAGGNLFSSYLTGLRGEGVRQRDYEQNQGEQSAKLWGGLAGDLINMGGKAYEGGNKPVPWKNPYATGDAATSLPIPLLG